MSQRRLLILIADGEHARLVRPAADQALHSESALDSTLAHRRAAELARDRPGASFHSGASAHHAETPRHDPHEMAKERFAASLAEQITEVEAAGGFDDLLLVAPAHVMATIREHLGEAARRRVVGTLLKDLTKVPDEALVPHLAQWMRPGHHRDGPGAVGGGG
ncbi:host attachment protein [Acidibrevibacterium fodinaquatile]|uniref:host attachment protein n=1 Tax=Acidibrevibacterium fodinaquatile TaxID=1969806 RepID=UPI000E0CD62C|nr:host attachment protein [Acidibrevibacterium fodinaquatile]